MIADRDTSMNHSKRMDKNEVIRTLKSLERQVHGRYRARVKGVFGSVARGEERPESDIDLLVEFLDGATLLDLVGLGLFFEEELGIPVDIVPIDTIRPELKPQILSEAIFV